MHSKSDNIEFMIHDKADKVMKAIFESLLNRYKVGLKHQWKIVILSLVMLICCIENVIKINFKHGVSQIDSPDWITNKIAATNPINENENKCF